MPGSTKGGPVLFLQGGSFVEEDVAERVLGVADNNGWFGNAADVVGEVGNGDDDNNDGNLQRRQVAPERVDRHRQE